MRHPIRHRHSHTHSHRSMLGVMLALGIVAALVAALPVSGAEPDRPVVRQLTQQDFEFGTFIIDQPGVYRLGEDISFNPNSPATLTAAIDEGLIPADVVGRLGLPSPVDAYHAGMPLPTQLAPGGIDGFTPGGPIDARYDPAAYGVGFFAAIVIAADDVVLDLAGRRIEQHPEHALLQRFFAVVELADQPFVPGQGPASFGSDLRAARRVTITNGTIGRSSHHGIHGNANVDVTIDGVDFEDYEVAAVALNGVDRLRVSDVTATNRKDVPVLGTFSSARFIQPYVDHLVRSGSETTLRVGGVTRTPTDIQAALMAAVNNTHRDIMVAPVIHPVVHRGPAPAFGPARAAIDPLAHPEEYALFHNRFGLVDGNSYSFLVNTLGVAVNGFPTVPDGETTVASRDVRFRNVTVSDQRAFVNEVVAVDVGGTAAIDPVGAVFQIHNLHPDDGSPVTISDVDDDVARYTGNPVANAQALVAKAAANGDFDRSHLDVSRSNIPGSVLDWVEAEPGSEVLADVDIGYYCNGDSMFHVNKGVIGFKMDGADRVRLDRTTVDGLANLGAAGSERCGPYGDGVSHPLANVNGFGGATSRAYTFAGSTDVVVHEGLAGRIRAAEGPAVGFEVLTDSRQVRLVRPMVLGVGAGSASPSGGESTPDPVAAGVRISPESRRVWIVKPCIGGLDGTAGDLAIDDGSGRAAVFGSCGRWWDLDAGDHELQ